MRIDPEDLRRQYAELTDESLLDLDRGELVEVAQKVYDEEVARRKMARRQEVKGTARPDEVAVAQVDLGIDTETPPDWLENPTCALTFQVRHGAEYAPGAIDAQSALRAAGIPCELTITDAEAEAEPPADPEPRQLCNVMVPTGLSLYAASVLDREIYNQELENAWRAHFEMLSDEELRALKPEIFCAGLLDKVARLKRAYEEELAQRG